MNVSTILEEVQPLADLAHEVIQAHNALRLSLQYNHYHPSAKGKLECYIKALEKLSSKDPNFPEISLPPTLSENIPQLRLEADRRLANIPQLTSRVEELIQNPPREVLSVDQREVYALLNECPIRTIGIFHQVCRKSRDRDYNGAYYGYQFTVDPLYLQTLEQRIPGDEWTRTLNSPKPLRLSVQLKNGISEDELKRFGKALPEGAVKEEYTQSLPDDLNKVHWVVGLTCDEGEVLLLHPLVRDVQPFKPKFDVSMAFD